MDEKKPKKSITIFLIASTMLLSFALFGCGLYSLYISIGFKFLSNSALINTSPLLTYSNSVYGTGNGTMVGLILISIVMLALGIGMAVVFFKQLPLYRQIKLIAKLPNIKYKQYSKEAKKGIVVLSIIAYIVCIAFAVFAIITAVSSGVNQNYLWAIVGSYVLVLVLSIASMVLMIVKVVQLSKIKNTMLTKELFMEEYTKPNRTEEQKSQKEEHSAEQVEIVPLADVEQTPVLEQIVDAQPKVETKTDRLFSDGIFELGEQLQKLREMHISGLIDAEEYTLIRQKWINAVLAVPLFDKKPRRSRGARQVNAADTATRP